MLTTKNFPTTVNGDNVIKFANSKKTANLGDVDLASMSDWYKEDPLKHHLGLLQSISRAEQISVPLLNSVLSTGGRIEVNGYDGRFTYDIPISTDTGMYTVIDTFGESQKPGIDGGIFKIGLSHELSPGDVITYDTLRGEQVVVTSEFPVFRDGDVYMTYVKLVGMNKSSYFPPEKLRAGIQYFKINHGAGEFSTQLSKVNKQADVIYAGCEFILGNLRGVEGSATMFAGDKFVDSAAISTNEFLRKIQSRAESFGPSTDKGEYNSVIIGQMSASGKEIVKGSAKVMHLIEYMALAELIKLENYSLMFQKAGLVADNNSVIRFNEGYYWQIRRGFRLEYSRPGHLPMSKLQEASEYLFRNRRDIKITDRRLKFKAGKIAYDNVIRLLTNEFQNQLQFLSPLLGGDRIIPNPVSGSVDALKLTHAGVAECFVPNIGYVTVEHDPSLDWNPMVDRNSRGFLGQNYPKTSCSLLIEDITASEYSNAFQNVPGSTNLSITNPNSNTFYVTPKQGSLNWGYENGRFDYRTSTNIMATNPKFAQNFFCYSSSAIWVKDLSRHILIELGDQEYFH